MGKSSGEERRRSQAGDLAALEEALSLLRRELAEGRMQAADPDTASRQVAAAVAAAVRQGALRAATGLAAADASSATVDVLFCTAILFVLRPLPTPTPPHP